MCSVSEWRDVRVGFFFFFKQKTAYEIVDCDWSSDVCSSDLGAFLPFCRGHAEKGTPRKEPWAFGDAATAHVRTADRKSVV